MKGKLEGRAAWFVLLTFYMSVWAFGVAFGVASGNWWVLVVLMCGSMVSVWVWSWREAYRAGGWTCVVEWEDGEVRRFRFYTLDMAMQTELYAQDLPGVARTSVVQGRGR